MMALKKTPNDWAEILKKAKMCWYAMNARCNRTYHHGYEYYGGKGIKVLVDQASFMAWFINEVLYVESLDSVSLSRIDHDGDYQLDNMKIEDLSVNTGDAGRRWGKWIAHVGPGNKKVRIVAEKDGIDVGFYSLRDCAKYIDASDSNVGAALKRRRKKVNGFTITYGDTATR